MTSGAIPTTWKFCFVSFFDIRSHVGLYATSITNSSSHVIFPMTSCAHCHTIIHKQSYRYNHTHTSMQWCCTMVKEPGLGTSTNMNWYERNHVGCRAATNCIWSSLRHHDIMPTLSYNHAHTLIQSHTIIHIQAYTYNHAMMLDTGIWNIPMKSCTYPGLCTCIGAVQRIDCRISGLRACHHSAVYESAGWILGLCACYPCSLPDCWSYLLPRPLAVS